ncbi:MAG: hypothetical protein WCP20_16125 [Desulfuromonadales bacterium]
MKKLLLLSLAISLGASGCGGGGGGSAELRTSYVTAASGTASLDADVISWVDASGAKATACAATSNASTPAADTVNVSVVSTTYSNTGSVGLPIRIESATISYAPANTATPPMASEFQTIGVIMTNGGTASVPVRVVSQEQKLRLQPKLACNATIYNYYTTITLNVTEIGTETKSTVTTSFQLRLADFVDK